MTQDAEANMWQRAFHQFLDIWVQPEIERRQADGSLPKPLELTKFQIVWFPDARERQIRINDEVKAKLQIKLRDGVAKNPGDLVMGSDVEAVEGIELTELDDRDCGHATFFSLGDRWCGSFDAIYNKGLSAEYLARGEEFLDAAKYCLGADLKHAFLDTLFSAVELFARAKLLVLAEFQLREKSNHRRLAARVNFHAHLGNVQAVQRDAFNTLSQSRYPARYLDQGHIQIDGAQANALVAAVESLRDDACKLVRL